VPSAEAAVHAFGGFVDLQVNGGFGHDFTAAPASIWEVAARLPEHGVTAFLPTVVSSATETALTAFRTLRLGPPPGWRGARPLGLHLEGPFLAPERRGTHEAGQLLRPDLELVEAWIDAGPPTMVTLAPELSGAIEIVQRLRAAGTVVALGHSACTAEAAHAAFAAGGTHATHLFNAMSGLDHREPGLAAAVLDHPTVTAGLIADGVHVHPTMLRLAHRVLGAGRLALVTDGIAGMGIGDGAFRLGDTSVTVAEGVARNQAGDLAGAVASMPQVVRTMSAATGADPKEILAMASSTPARVVGFTPSPTDEVLLDDDFDVISTTIDGEVAYRRTDR
jgi:N-acetylglucosamine-6-phosphate deacetylase